MGLITHSSSGVKSQPNCAACFPWANRLFFEVRVILLFSGAGCYPKYTGSITPGRAYTLTWSHPTGFQTAPLKPEGTQCHGSFFPSFLIVCRRHVSGKRFPYSTGLNGCCTEVLFFPLVACPSWEGDPSPWALLNWTCTLTACQLLANFAATSFLSLPTLRKETDAEGCPLYLTEYALSLLSPRNATLSRQAAAQHELNRAQDGQRCTSRYIKWQRITRSTNAGSSPNLFLQY